MSGVASWERMGKRLDRTGNVNETITAIDRKPLRSKKIMKNGSMLGGGLDLSSVKSNLWLLYSIFKGESEDDNVPRKFR